MIKLEKTYLLKEIPEGLKECKFKEIIDIYIPKNKEHPKLRLRKNGENYELTKKEPISENDKSRQKEQTIILNEDEFKALSKIKGEKLRKIRYYYKYNDKICEIDVFQDDLTGLIVADFEFETVKEKNNFATPEFCLKDITQEEFIAGGIICGRCYEDIAEELLKFGYKKLFL